MAEIDSISVEEKEVDKALDQQIEMLIAQAGGEERAEEALGQSISDFRREFWYDMKDRLVSEKYQQQLIGSISVTRSEIELFFDAYKDSIVIDGELREGNILRVGRLAMVFQTADETQTHAWNNEARAWEELDNSYRNPTKRGLRIANKLATVALMELPLPAPTEAN